MTKEIQLTKGEVAIVDDEDYEELSKVKWHYNGGYAVRNVVINGKRKVVRMHRVVSNANDEATVDHINRNKLDNRRENLRLCSLRENTYNKSSQKNSASKYIGVSFDTVSGYFKGSVRQKHLGYFDSEIACANAYNYYAEIEYGKFAPLNEVPFMSKDQWELHIVSRKTSKYIGIGWNKQRNKWRCRIKNQGGKWKDIGFFAEEADAVKAYNKKAIELFGEQAKLQEVFE